MLSMYNLMSMQMLLAKSLPDQLKELVGYLQGGVESAMNSLAQGVQGAATTTADWGGGNMAGLAMTVFTFTGLDGGLVAGLITYITGPVGFMMMLIYFLTSFLNQYKAGKEITIDEVARPMFFLIVADLVLTNIGPIISALMGISNLGAKTLVENWSSISSTAAEQEWGASSTTDIGNISLFGLLPLIITNFVSFLFSIIASAILFVVLITAKMEVLLRFSYAPIGLSGIADESRKDDVFRYFKKLVASAFYLIAIIAALQYCMHMGQGLLAASQESEANIFIKAMSGVESTFFTMALPFAAIGMVSIAKNIVNESFGV
ncbi:MAG: hypothetical protein IJV29_11430 [Butyrivibrio sp.]|nr:hypothetical protein [Butyrivibrio sp.]